MPMSGLPEDAIERFFEKSSEKRERFQKFWKYTRCGRFFQKSGTVFRIFGNIPDMKNFLKKVGAISDFLHMYCMQDASSMRGGNAGGLFITFPEEVLSSKWHTNHSKSVIWQMRI